MNSPFILVGDILKEEVSEILGYIDSKHAVRWKQYDQTGKVILKEPGLMKHIKKHDEEYRCGLNSKDYTMEHLSDIIQNPEYVSYNSEHNSFEYFKCLKEYVVVTVRLSKKRELIVTSVFPISKNKMDDRIFEENKILSSIDETSDMQELIEKYTHKDDESINV